MFSMHVHSLVLVSMMIAYVAMSVGMLLHLAWFWYTMPRIDPELRQRYISTMAVMCATVRTSAAWKRQERRDRRRLLLVMCVITLCALGYVFTMV